MRSNKTWLLFALFALVGGVLWAGGSSEAGGSITWWSPTWNDPRGDELAAAFEKANPGYTVEVQKTVGQGLQNKVLVALQSGSPPELIDTQIPWVVPYASTGYIQPLDDYLKASDVVKPGDFYPAVWKAMVSDKDGKTYGVPYRSEAHAFIYNKKFYREAGLDPNKPPTTWAELQDYARQLTDTSKTPAQYGVGIVGGGEIGNIIYNMLPWIWANGGDVLSADYTHATINEPAAVQAVDFYTSLLTKYHYAPPSTVQNGGNQVRDLFAQGVVAQFQSGSYIIGPVTSANPDIEMGFGVIPAPAGKQPAAILGGWAYVIPKDAANKTAAWKFVEFLAQTKNMAYYTDTFPPTPAAMADARFADPRLDAFKEMLKYARSTPPVDGWPQMQQVIFNQVQEILLGRKSAQQAMDDAAAKINELL